MLGYRSDDGGFYVVPEEAVIVKRIFKMFLSGMGTLAIANKLNAEGVRARRGKEFCKSGVAKILKNDAYTGNLLLQKTFRDDPIVKNMKINNGELPKYLVENAHEAIIEKDIWYWMRPLTVTGGGSNGPRPSTRIKSPR